VNGVYDVYCKTVAERCRPDSVYLGKLPANTKARCPVCGRWSWYEPEHKKERVKITPPRIVI